MLCKGYRGSRAYENGEFRIRSRLHREQPMIAFGKYEFSWAEKFRSEVDENLT